MQTATIWLELDSTLKNNVRKSGVTPAQASILWDMFGKTIEGEVNKTNPFQHIVIDEGEKDIANSEEYARLSHIYGSGKESPFKRVFPGSNPALPKTFKEIGLSDTEQPEPKSGKKHTIDPLASLKKGDLTDDEKLEAVSASHPLAEMHAVQKAKVEEQAAQIKALTEKVDALVKLIPPAPVEPAREETAHS